MNQIVRFVVIVRGQCVPVRRLCEGCAGCEIASWVLATDVSLAFAKAVSVFLTGRDKA